MSYYTFCFKAHHVHCFEFSRPSVKRNLSRCSTKPQKYLTGHPNKNIQIFGKSKTSKTKVHPKFPPKKTRFEAFQNQTLSIPNRLPSLLAVIGFYDLFLEMKFLWFCHESWKMVKIAIKLAMKHPQRDEWNSPWIWPPVFLDFFSISTLQEVDPPALKLSERMVQNCNFPGKSATIRNRDDMDVPRFSNCHHPRHLFPWRFMIDWYSIDSNTCTLPFRLDVTILQSAKKWRWYEIKCIPGLILQKQSVDNQFKMTPPPPPQKKKTSRFLFLLFFFDLPKKIYIPSKTGPWFVFLVFNEWFYISQSRSMWKAALGCMACPHHALSNSKSVGCRPSRVERLHQSCCGTPQPPFSPPRKRIWWKKHD